MKAILDFYNDNTTLINIIIGLAVIAILFVFKKKIAKLILTVLGKIFFAKKPDKEKTFKDSLIKPISTFFAVLGLYIGITINYQHQIITDAFKIITILIVCWSILNFISANLTDIFNVSSENHAINGVAVKFISNLLKVLVVCIAIVMVLAELGYNINGLITGLGVGGLAVSLSAQDTLKNLISGFVILFDKPFDVGDLIETADFKGFVEDITMRSTRIRKFDDSVIIVPNSTLADSSISNYARLTRKLVELDIGLLYSTSEETIKKCEDDIKAYLENNDLVDNETIKVFFTAFASSSLNINIKCYINTTDLLVYNDFMEKLNFTIKNIVEENKTDFAYPTRSLIIENK